MAFFAMAYHEMQQDNGCLVPISSSATRSPMLEGLHILFMHTAASQQLWQQVHPPAAAAGNAAIKWSVLPGPAASIFAYRTGLRSSPCAITISVRCWLALGQDGHFDLYRSNAARTHLCCSCCASCCCCCCFLVTCPCSSSWYVLNVNFLRLQLKRLSMTKCHLRRVCCCCR